MSKSLSADDGADELPEAESDDAIAKIVTHGDPIRSFAALPNAIVDEAKLRITEDGLHITAVDPANVGLVDVTAHAEGFAGFDVTDETVFGLDVDRFKKSVSWARKRGDGDPVTIQVFENPARMRVQVTRPDQGVARRTEWFGIDPMAIREEPEVPDLQLPCRADPDVSALADGVDAFENDYVWLSRDGETFLVGSSPDGSTTPDPDDDYETVGESVMFPSTAWTVEDDEPDDVRSYFAMGYLGDMVDAIDKSKADRVTVSWGDDFPTTLDFEHADWGFEGSFLLAPRMKPEDDDE